MDHDVFISYAVEDTEAAERVCRALEDTGIKCWIAPRDVPFGADYEEVILEAIEASRFLVLIFSAHANASQHVEREIRKAFEESSKTQVFPFRIEEVAYNKVLSYYLGGAQWIDASKPPPESPLRRLVEHVRAHLRGPAGAPPAYPVEGAPIPPPLPHKPFPVALLAAAAVALLLVVVVAFVVTRPRGGGREAINSSSSNLATPVANSNVNERASPTPRTPTPTPTPRPARTPIRVFPTNLNVR